MKRLSLNRGSFPDGVGEIATLAGLRSKAFDR